MTLIDSDDVGALVAHELAGPLMAVGMAAQSLRRLLDDDFLEAVELVGVIEQQAAHGGSVLAGLVDLARAGRTPWREAVDLGELVAEADPGIEGLRVGNRCTGVVVDADPLPLRQAVANLLANAARHGGGDATVWCEQSRDEWRVLVADRGPGLDADEAARVFRSFERGRRSRQVKGDGLGLAVVVAVAKAHDGEAGWSPRPGGGSIFWFTLRRHVQFAGARPAG